MKQISIRGLYHHFNYDIPLSEDGITILTGPNGFGKSTIIHCIEAISNSDLEFFFGLEFSRLEIQMDEDNPFVIEKKHDILLVDGERFDRRAVFYGKRALQRSYNDEDDAEIAEMMEHYVQIMTRMKQVTGIVQLIREQRLIEVRRRVTRNADTGRREARHVIRKRAEKIPEQFKLLIGEASTEYSNIANELDSTFPERLFNQKEGLHKDEYNQKAAWMTEKAKKLDKYGISNIRRIENVQFREADARALKVYFEDFERKYEQYEDLIERFDLFTDIINRRFLFKQVFVSSESGLLVKDNDTGEAIDLSELSSGEQEMLVLFYQLIFETEENSMLLVDEPEISLHVAWQRMFIEDMKRIVQSRKLTAIIATHSPQIINGNRKIQVDLGEIYQNGLNTGK